MPDLKDVLLHCQIEVSQENDASNDTINGDKSKMIKKMEGVSHYSVKIT